MQTKLLLAATLTALASPAYAADLGPAPYIPPPVNWTGFYVGGGVGAGFLDTSLFAEQKRDDSLAFCRLDGGKCVRTGDPFLNLNQKQSFTDDLGDDGFFGTVQLGYDWQMGRWLIGAFADGDWYDNLEVSAGSASSSNLNIDLGRNGLNVPLSKRTIDAEIGVDSSWTIGGRFGWLATENALLYGLAAYTQVELDNSQVNFLIDDSVGGAADKFFHTKLARDSKFGFALPDELDGFTLGGGGEIKLGHASPWSLKLEYRWTHLDGDSKSDSDSKSQSIPIERYLGLEREINSKATARLDDVDIQTVRANVVYKFNGFGG